MKEGTAKQKKVLQFYQGLVKTGQSPLPYREPQPETPKRPLNVALLLHFPGADDRWAWRWDGEDYESWEHRLRLGYLDWSRYIESVKNSKNKIVKTKVSFYVNLMREENYPKPIEDWRCVAKLGGLREQQEWIDRTKAEIPSLIPAWRAKIMQTLETPSIPIPSGLQEWQRKWWHRCWEENYRTFSEEDKVTLHGLKGMKSAQRELELLRENCASSLPRKCLFIYLSVTPVKGPDGEAPPCHPFEPLTAGANWRSSGVYVTQQIFK
jgi:hypothetical protein